jgi:hypothetical protein
VLLFELHEPLTVASTVTLEIPAGASSLVSEPLSEPLSFELRTPAPSVVAHYPTNACSSPLDGILCLQFDQQVTAAASKDPTAHIHLYSLADGTATHEASHPLKRIPREQAQAHLHSKVLRGKPRERRILERLLASDKETTGTGFHVWLAPISPLPAACRFRLVVSKGLPSLEGGYGVTSSAESFEFKTVGAFAICTHFPRNAAPSESWQVVMSNDIDHRSLTEKSIAISPAIEDQQLLVSANVLTIKNRSRANRTYEVTFSPSVSDIFGSRLGVHLVVRFSVGGASASARAISASVLSMSLPLPRSLQICNEHR